MHSYKGRFHNNIRVHNTSNTTCLDKYFARNALFSSNYKYLSSLSDSMVLVKVISSVSNDDRKLTTLKFVLLD